MHEIDVLRIDVPDKKARSIRDFVAEEKPLHVFVNRTPYATIFCTPANLKELAIGHMVAEGLVKSIEDIERVQVEGDVCRIIFAPSVHVDRLLRLQRHFERVILSACGSKGPYRPSLRLPRIKQGLAVRADVLLNCVNRLNSLAETFRKTGGVHAAAVFKADGDCVAFAEDVGRHNAVDKALGIAIMQRSDLRHCFLTLTGRLTADIVVKAVRVGLPIVASIAAGLDSGIAVAKKANLTLLGFVRGKRINIYSCPERISI